jgi:hypothetical protein
MMELPEWLDIELSENTACAMYRNLRGLSGSWGEMLAEAQTVMSHYQDLPHTELSKLYDQSNALPLIAAARILDTASKPPSTLQEDASRAAGYAAAVAFAMCGNFASSRATVKRVMPKLQTITAEDAILFATVSPGFLPQMLERTASSTPHREYLELLNAYYATGIAAIKDRELNAVAATTTLAEGVDLPFRFTVIADWMLWQSGKHQPMSTLLFKNIAGRCGRAGVYSEGDTIIFDNPLGDLRFTHATSRDSIQQELFLKNEPSAVGSVINDVIETSSLETENADAVLTSQFLAAIPENPHEEDLAKGFAQSTYASFLLPNNTDVIRLFKATSISLLDRSRGALAVAASPLKLTDFGAATNSSGFSPASARRIVQSLQQEVDEVDIASVCDHLLKSLRDLPEQTFTKFRDVFIKPKSHFPVKPQDIRGVIQRWLDNTPHLDNFAELSTVKKAQRQMTFDEWIEGPTETTSWDESYDAFTDFITIMLESYLPWLLRACGLLCLHAGGWSTGITWQNWAAQLEAVASRDVSAGDSDSAK